MRRERVQPSSGKQTTEESSSRHLHTVARCAGQNMQYYLGLHLHMVSVYSSFDQSFSFSLSQEQHINLRASKDHLTLTLEDHKNALVAAQVMLSSPLTDAFGSLSTSHSACYSMQQNNSSICCQQFALNTDLCTKP